MEDCIQANKLLILGKLTASLVHEIRNPLSAIKLNLDYMNMAQDDLPPDMREIVAESLDAFEQVSFLIEDVLDFTRKPSANIHQVNIESITDRCLKIISVSARMKGVSIEKSIDSNLPQLNANKNKVMQIFLNLLNNAIEASSDKEKIIVRSYMLDDKNEKFLIWETEDFGCGIKEEDKEKVLSEFYTTKSRGHGIGLGVCKSLAAEMHCELNFNSVYGKGTRFYVKFALNY